MFTRISVIIPSFNTGSFLEQSIRSVLSQDVPDPELILIDGGSRDSSIEIIRGYADRLAYWESGPDRGQSHAINKGFARATGEIITFLSGDDYYLPGAFMDVATQYQKHPESGAIIGGFCILDEGHYAPGEPQRPFLRGDSPVDLSLGPPGKYRLHQVATFYTRAALDAVGRSVREDMKYVMDRELLYRVCRQFPLALSKKPYGVFRRHAASKSVSETLPFAREFARLYLLALSGDTQQDRLRKQMAAYRLSRGYVKYANAVRRFPDSQLALARAGLLYPSLLVSTGYWHNYLSLK
jgi:glycosyltransferase involved in cell wall biosynthesis